MASDETKPRRFDLTMSRRTRRPPAKTSATSCHEQHHQAVDVEGLGLFQPAVVQDEDPDALFCLSGHLQSRQPEDEDAHQEHGKSKAQPQQKAAAVEEQCQDNSHRFSLQELVEDEAADDGVKAAAAATEENAAAAAGVDAEGGGAAAAGADCREAVSWTAAGGGKEGDRNHAPPTAPCLLIDLHDDRACMLIG